MNDENNFYDSLSRAKVEEAMRDFNYYLTSQYDGMLSVLNNGESFYIKIDLKKEDVSLFLKHVDKLRFPKIVKIGEYEFEYVGQYKDDENSPVLKFNKSIFTLNFYNDLDAAKKYMMEKNFKNLSKVKIQDVSKIEGNELSVLKYTARLKMYKIKINEDSFITKDSFSDEDGFIFVSTNNPASIYNNFGTDNVISVEKVGNTYVI